MGQVQRLLEAKNVWSFIKKAQPILFLYSWVYYKTLKTNVTYSTIGLTRKSELVLDERFELFEL